MAHECKQIHLYKHICILYTHLYTICVYTHTFSKSFESFIYHRHLFSEFECIFSQNKNIALHNPSTVIGMKKCNIDTFLSN